MDNKCRKWFALASAIVTMSMLYIDQAGVTSTLPAIYRETGISTNIQYWIVNSYILAITVFIAFGGYLSDIIGCSKSFIIGVFGFGFFSFLCGVSSDISYMILYRTLQGVFGAIMMPNTMTIIMLTFVGNERAKAIGMYVSIASIFLITGPYICGSITEYINWRYVYILNVPLCILCIYTIMISRKLIASEQKISVRKKHYIFDIKGSILLGLANISIVVAFMEISNTKCSIYYIISMIVLAIFFYVYLFLVEKGQKNPIIDTTILKDKVYFSCFLLSFIAQICIVVRTIMILVLQIAMQYSASKVGLLMLPMTIPTMFIGYVAPKMAEKYGSKTIICCGLVILFISSICMFIFYDMSNYLILFTSMLLYGTGMPMVMAIVNSTAFSNIPKQKMGLASGLFGQIRQFGGSFGFAILGSTLTSVSYITFSNTINIRNIDINKDSVSYILISSINHISHKFSISQDIVPHVVQIAKYAYLNGYRFCMLEIIALILIGFMITYKSLPNYANINNEKAV